ncbi:alpha-glucosidase [Tetragenococcus halophilus subsp. flandriensis]|uniref:glycoside hydrolase family 97 catalytic domain-containing protein n=1 Tax=Tetragenococcus halophilus TaxID=51669 RepID=UPI0023E9C916|nr:glycoside hydrolase family 97 catalytic domain-containing protein [Tetragenococcus halophilus]GMA09055.1 alpha-glucosidase [Tetragenococcus halophilus subsp. flandriensis]
MKKSIKALLGIGFMICLFLPTSSVEAASDSTSNEEGGSSELMISSPNGEVDLNFSLTEEGIPQYQLSYNNMNLLEPSLLGGFEFKDQEALSDNFELIDSSTESFEEEWLPEWGDKEKIENNYEQLTVALLEKDENQRQMNIEFRVYDDGIGFRYVLPEQENLDGNLEITSEDTEFSFTDENTSWWIPRDWDNYELEYTETPLSEVEDVHTPFTMETPDGIHLSVHEAGLIDYSSMALEEVENKENTLAGHLAPWPDSDVKVKKDSLPIETPWRMIQIGKDAGDLFESDLMLNLNEPNQIEDTSWIEPTKYVGVWWEMISGKSEWASGADHGATTENAKKYIDFASEFLDTKNQNIGMLVEGWNEGWDGEWADNGDLFSFTQPYPDFDLDEVVNYAHKNNIGYIMHNETSGDILNYEEQMDEAYQLYQDLGIHSIKSGYVADEGMHNPEGQHHHGQYMINHYLEAVKKAADHQIMVDTHEPIKGTGLERTYPNWMSREGVSGMEYSAFGEENNPPEHDTILPFTRGLSGPIDFTPGIFDTEISHSDEGDVDTTRAKQLALYVTISTGTQMVADLPENYKDDNGNILPEFQFIKDVPVDWDETLVPNSEIGDYATMVRRSGDEWYLGSITDEEARDIDIELDFLDDGQEYVAEIYSDADDADYEDNPHAVDIEEKIVGSEDTLTASLARSGGQAVRITPTADEKREETSEMNKEEYTIKKEDTLFDIGMKYNLSWDKIYEVNREQIADSDLIYPEQIISIPLSEK